MHKIIQYLLPSLYLNQQIKCELSKIFAHIYAGSALSMHGHERPREKGVNIDASLQQHKPHLVQPVQPENQQSNKVNEPSEHVNVLVLYNTATQVMRSYQNVI